MQRPVQPQHLRGTSDHVLDEVTMACTTQNTTPPVGLGHSWDELQVRKPIIYGKEAASVATQRVGCAGGVSVARPRCEIRDSSTLP